MRFWISYNVSATFRGVDMSFTETKVHEFATRPTEKEINDFQEKVREEYRVKIRELTCAIRQGCGRDISTDDAQKRLDSVVDKNCPRITVIAFSELG